MDLRRDTAITRGDSPDEFPHKLGHGIHVGIPRNSYFILDFLHKPVVKSRKVIRP